MERRRSGARVDVRPLRATMDRLGIPLRRVRRNFRTRLVTTGGLYGRMFWRSVGGARVGGFLGFLTDPVGWEALDPRPPHAIVFAFVRPAGGPLYRRLVLRRGSLFERVARTSVVQGAPFELHRGRTEALVRHRSMAGRPDEILVLTAADFFMTSFRVFWSADFLDRLLKVRARPARRKKG